MAIIIDGKALAAKCKEEVRTAVAAMERKPGLAVILVGENPASQVYVRNKQKDCQECGIHSEEFVLPADYGQPALLTLIAELNRREDIDGILCQLPLPEGYGYDEEKILLAIDPSKDVDAFHPYNVGKIMIGDPSFLPCTPAGVMKMLDEYHIDVDGKHCVVVGRSNIVGKPMAMLLLHRNGTVCDPSSRHPGFRRRQTECHHRRHGEGRRCGHRRSHEPQRTGQALRRCGFRCGGEDCLLHHPRPRRLRPYDPCHFDGEHPPCSSSPREVNAYKHNAPGQ